MRHLCMEVPGWQRWCIFRPLLRTANHPCCCSWTTWHIIQNKLDHSTFFTFNTVTMHHISSSNQMLNPYQFTIIIRVYISSEVTVLRIGGISTLLVVSELLLLPSFLLGSMLCLQFDDTCGSKTVVWCFWLILFVCFLYTIVSLECGYGCSAHSFR